MALHQTQGLHMLNTKSKKIKSYNCPFCLMSNHEIELNLKKKKFPKVVLDLLKM